MPRALSTILRTVPALGLVAPYLYPEKNVEAPRMDRNYIKGQLSIDAQ